jgi:ABC-type molybdenum transport system ATPase subunit/photorepair protein PhrA
MALLSFKVRGAMAVRGLDRSAFADVLTKTLSPTTPIRSVEALRGRERKLEDIRRALIQPGRHIFIFGDRGVGKTSLAQTAAFEHQSASNEPILLGCDTGSTFYRIIYDLAVRLLNTDPTILKKTAHRRGSLNVPSVIAAEHQQTVERGQIGEPRSMNEAVALLEHACRIHSQQPVAVIDEFERITSSRERALFADFISAAAQMSSSPIVF